jgi:thiamine pyrophosphate-dependent acetolactate synthase large subunit-like protein
LNYIVFACEGAANEMLMTKGSNLLVAALGSEGVDRIYGIPGEENLDVVDAIRSSSIELVLTRHEQAAAFMTATYGRLTGKPGVCITTLGPGALNLTTGAAYALLGAMPMMMITDQKGRCRPSSMYFTNSALIDPLLPVETVSFVASEITHRRGELGSFECPARDRNEAAARHRHQLSCHTTSLPMRLQAS